jgi:hypothetical protein
MTRTTRSARAFQERRGLRPTFRGPLPALEAGGNPAHRIALSPPLPLAPFQALAQGDDPPDRGATHAWPWPDPVEE